MAVDANKVLAGIAGLDGTPSLAWFAPEGTTLPTDPTSALDAAFLDLGFCSTDGLTISTDTESEDIQAYGSFSIVRRIISSETKTFSVTGLETNTVSLAIQNRLPLDEVVADVDGSIAVDFGEARSVRYAAVFTAMDGDNLIRKVCPAVELGEVGDEAISRGTNIAYEFTMTAYPDENGKSVYSYYLVDALASGS